MHFWCQGSHLCPHRNAFLTMGAHIGVHWWAQIRCIINNLIVSSLFCSTKLHVHKIWLGGFVKFLITCTRETVQHRHVPINQDNKNILSPKWKHTTTILGYCILWSQHKGREEWQGNRPIKAGGGGGFRAGVKTVDFTFVLSCASPFCSSPKNDGDVWPQDGLQPSRASRALPDTRHGNVSLIPLRGSENEMRNSVAAFSQDPLAVSQPYQSLLSKSQPKPAVPNLLCLCQRCRSVLNRWSKPLDPALLHLYIVQNKE